MTDFKVGDRIRAVQEGVVVRVDQGEFDLDTGSGDVSEYWDTDTDPGFSYEVLVRAPRVFAPGTLVETSAGTVFRAPHGWIWGDGLECSADDESVAAWLRYKNPAAKVLYEPPTS